MFSLKNPVFLFVLTWLTVLYIYSKQYSLLLLPIKSITIIYIMSACIMFYSGYVFVKLIFYDKKLQKIPNFSVNAIIGKNLKKIFIIWVLFTFFEIVYFRGLPLLSILGLGGGIDRYTEWGIPSLHGLLNAIIITISNYQIYFYFKTKNKVYLYRFIGCLLWPILLITRQMFLSIVMQSIFIYILTHRFKTFTIVRFAVLALVVVFLFGLVGDLRSGEDSFLALVQPSKNYPTWLPSGFLWVYIYMVSPLNNVNFNIHKYPDFYFNLSPLLSSFFPSFIREKIFPPSNQFNFQLVNENLNVSTMFPTYLESFGFYGSLLFYFFLGVVLSYMYYKYKTSGSANIKWLFVVVILIHNIVFSVFVDFFFNLVFLFQIVLHLLLSYKFKVFNDKI